VRAKAKAAAAWELKDWGRLVDHIGTDALRSTCKKMGVRHPNPLRPPDAAVILM